MAIAQNYPEIKPSLNLDFANVKKLDPRISFARASGGTYYDGKTVAKAEENLFLRSQEFDNASAGAWEVTSTSVSANTTVAPDGTTTADTVTASAGTALKYIGQDKTLSGIYTYSVHAKAGTHSIIQLLFGGVNPAGSAFANFNIAAGSGAVGSSAGGTASIIDVGDGWYRCVFTGNLTGGTNALVSFVDSTSATRAQSTTSTGTIILWGAQLETGSVASVYVATTTTPAPAVYQPKLLTAPANVARFDHDPVTGESLGLLVEEQRTNEVLYSEDFGNAYWSKVDATIASNTIVAPDGTLTGDKIVSALSGVAPRVQIIPTLADNTNYTFSIYCTKGEWSWVNLIFRNKAVSADPGAWFNLEAGSIGTVNSGITASIQDVGNGCYKCSITSNSLSGGIAPNLRIRATNADNTLTTGDGYSGIYIWGAQLEPGSFPTSYIKTEASQVTRSADSASMTGANFSEWYRQDEGTLYADVMPNSSLDNRVSLDFNAGVSNANTMILYAQRNNNDGFLGFVVANSVSQVAASTQGNAAGKTVFAYKVNNFATTRNGNTTFVDTSGLVPQGIDRVFIGDDYNRGNCVNGTIKKLSYYPARLTNEQLVALTS